MILKRCLIFNEFGGGDPVKALLYMYEITKIGEGMSIGLWSNIAHGAGDKKTVASYKWQGISD
jgi:hypothetical protein